MYKQHFGLSIDPFSMTPDPEMLYMTPSHREALSGLAYAVLQGKGFITLTGEAGTGKTTVLNRTLGVLHNRRVVSSVILNPSLTEAEFLELVLLDFGLEDVPASKPRRWLRFQEFLLQKHQEAMIPVVVVDEAHRLTPSLLEEIRLLSNLEKPGVKLLQIILAGQPELVGLLNRPDLRQLSQRISVRLKIDFLKPPEVQQYIELRWSKSGTAAAPFSPGAFAAIAKMSRGIPRLVNSICDNALMAAFADRAKLVELRHVAEACADLGLGNPEAIANGVHPKPVVASTVTKPASKDLKVIPAPLAGPIGQIRVLESFDRPRRRSWFFRWISGRQVVQ